MSQTGQNAPPLVDIVRPGLSIAGVAMAYDAGDYIPPHRHRDAQLIFAITGAMTVRTGDGRWVVPPQRAVWVPAYEGHSIRMNGHVDMRTVYIRRKKAEQLLRTCAVVQVSPLLREIILRTMSFARRFRSDSIEGHLAAVFFDEIRSAQQEPVHLPIPRDPRLQRITSALRKNPGDERTLAQWSKSAGASERTLARLFVGELSLTFAQWRQQARLLAALEMLALGQSVTATALDLGYESPSAFISMFRRALGVSPGRYFSDSQELNRR